MTLPAIGAKKFLCAFFHHAGAALRAAFCAVFYYDSAALYARAAHSAAACSVSRVRRAGRDTAICPSNVLQDNSEFEAYSIRPLSCRVAVPASLGPQRKTLLC